MRRIAGSASLTALAASGGAELDWYLTRSQIQSRLGQYSEAAEGFTEQKTRAAVRALMSATARSTLTLAPRICGAGVAPGGTSSSPLARMATEMSSG